MLAKKKLVSKTKLVAKKPIPKTSGKPKAKPQKGISWYKKEADKWWSLATRYRFAELKDGEYWAECITCGSPAPVKKLQCGHFMSRQYNSTRYVEQNTAPQCFGCNVMHQGRQYEFGMALDGLYGAHTANEMHELAKVPHQWKRDELLEIIKDAKTEVEFYEK